MSDPVFLDVEDVLFIHEEQLPRYHIAQNQPFVDGNKRACSRRSCSST